MGPFEGGGEFLMMSKFVLMDEASLSLLHINTREMSCAVSSW